MERLSIGCRLNKLAIDCRSSCQVLDLGLLDYGEAYQRQRELLLKRKAGLVEDILIVLEHPPVITCGRAAKPEELLVDEEGLAREGISFYPVDRGGGFTYHGPGQLVAYPILDLKSYDRDIHLYLRRLEEVIIEFLARYGVAGERVKGLTGVWVGARKIASIGIGVSGWVSYHGLSLNVDPDMEHFSMIRPCGLSKDLMTSLAEVLGEHPEMEEIKPGFIEAFFEVFGLERAYVNPSSILA